MQSEAWRRSSSTRDSNCRSQATWESGGAILLKARAVEIDDAPENQRSDVALLLSLVLDPDAMVDQLEGQERSWIARRHEMDDPNARCWRTLSPTQAQAGLAALRVLAGW